MEQLTRARKFTGKNVYLSPVEETDLRQIQIWINDPRINRNLNTYLPLTMEDEKKWYKRISIQNQNNIVLAIVLKESDALLGIMGIHNIHPVHQTATTGAFIGELSAHGKGYGSDAKMLLLHHAFMDLQLKKVNSSAKGFNEKSIQYSLKCGYVKEGLRKGEFAQGDDRVDEVLLAVTKKTWRPKWKEYIKGYESEIRV